MIGFIKTGALDIDQAISRPFELYSQLLSRTEPQTLDQFVATVKMVNADWHECYREDAEPVALALIRCAESGVAAVVSVPSERS